MSAKCTPTLIVFCLDVIKHFVVVFGINNSQKGKQIFTKKKKRKKVNMVDCSAAQVAFPLCWTQATNRFIVDSLIVFC